MRKYERGRVSEGPWVFGVAEQGYQKVVVFRVPDRTRETLVKHIITTHILAGPIIYFDKFPQYIPFNQLRYIHLLVQELCWSCTHQYHRRCLGLDQEEVEVDVWYPVCFLGNKWRMSFFFIQGFQMHFLKICSTDRFCVALHDLQTLSLRQGFTMTFWAQKKQVRLNCGLERHYSCFALLCFFTYRFMKMYALL